MGGLICTVIPSIYQTCIPNGTGIVVVLVVLVVSCFTIRFPSQVYLGYTIDTYFRAIERIIGLTHGKYVCLWRDGSIF